MQVLKNIIIIFIVILPWISCTAPAIKIDDAILDENSDFFKKEPGANEAYRVLITSDYYIVLQSNYGDILTREDDAEGDKYFCERLSAYNKVDISRDAVISVNLYPDTGKLMKIRPKSLTNIMEIDNLIVEDIKRWNLGFSEDKSGPGTIDVFYRVILSKKQSDDEIMKEVREKLKEDAENKGRGTQID